MDVAQLFGSKPASIADLQQLHIAQPIGDSAEPTQQSSTLPLQWLLVNVLPGPGLVVGQHRTIAVAQLGVFDHPVSARLIQHLLVVVLIDAYVGALIELILA